MATISSKPLPSIHITKYPWSATNAVSCLLPRPPPLVLPPVLAYLVVVYAVVLGDDHLHIIALLLHCTRQGCHHVTHTSNLGNGRHLKSNVKNRGGAGGGGGRD